MAEKNISVYKVPELKTVKAREGIHRIKESQNGRGWKGPLWVI